MRRTLVFLVAVSLCLGPILPAVSAVPDARLSVADVSVGPDRPTTGEPTTVSATVALSAGSNSPAEIDAIRLQDGTDTLAEAEDVGSISPGDTVSVDLVAAFDEAGRHDLTIKVDGTDDAGVSTSAERPVTVVVEDSPPTIDVDGTLVAGVESTLSVNLSNPAVDPIRNVDVAVLEGTSLGDSDTEAVIDPGDSANFEVATRPDSVGPTDARIRVAYTTATGDRQTTVTSTEFDAEPLDDDLGVEIRPIQPEEDADDDAAIDDLIGGVGDAGEGLEAQDDATNAPTGIEVVVTNFGNVPVSDAVVEPSAAESVPRAFLGGIEPGETVAAPIDLAAVAPGTVEIDVSYRIDDEHDGTASVVYDHRPATAAVDLTGVDVERTDGDIRITGNAANVGEAPVTGVVVGVGDAENVTGAYPQRDYFVGTVDGSEFAPFELTASVSGAADAIPVEIRYRVAGADRVEVVELPIESTDEDTSTAASLSPFAAGAGVGGLLGIGVLLPLYLWRR
ncbi:MAG: hypothetical protein PPP58_01630 [Natronomonas sp.]